MTFLRFMQELRRRWLGFALILFLVNALIGGLTYLTPKVYEAGAEVLVTARSGTSGSDMVNSSTYAQNQVQSYVEVTQSPLVLVPVIQAQKLDATPESLAQRLTVSVPARTSLIDLQLRDTSAERAASTVNAIANQLASTIQTLETPAGAGRSNVQVTILRTASVPTHPISPVLWRNALLSLVTSLVLGLAYVFLRMLLNTRILAESDLEFIKGDRPVIGAIPWDAQTTKNPLARTTSGRPTVRAEAIKTARTNLRFAQLGGAKGPVLVTSSLPGEGKSVTALNLAASLAESGVRVCLIEADLRRPRLMKYLNMDGTPGLTNVLIGSVPLEDALQESEIDGLVLLGSGSIPPNPSELLSSTQMRDLLAALDSSFDVVVLDAPPLLPVTDAAVLSAYAGGCVVVVGMGIVHRKELAQSFEALERVDAKILGLIANRVPVKSAPSQYSYYEYTDRDQGALEKVATNDSAS